jgi:hypothetical protein
MKDAIDLAILSCPLIVSYIANEPIRGERTSKSGRYGRICGGTLFIDNVGINNTSVRQSVASAVHFLLAA